MVMPKYGILSMILQAFQEKACEDLAVIPVYIGYDRVIEEKAYLRRVGRRPKGEGEDDRHDPEQANCFVNDTAAFT